MRRLVVLLGALLLVGTLATTGIPKETEDYSTLDGPWTVHLGVPSGYMPGTTDSVSEYNEYVIGGSCMKISHVRIWKKTHDITLTCEL